MKGPFNRRSLCEDQLNFKFTSRSIETVEAIFLFFDAFPEGAATCVPEVHGIYQQASSARQSNCGTSAIFEGLFANAILMTSSNSQKWIWTGLLKTFLKDLIKMLNVLATQRDKTQRQIISFINCLFISLLELQGRVSQSPIKATQG